MKTNIKIQIIIYFVLLFIGSISCRNRNTPKQISNQVLIGKEVTLEEALNPTFLQILDSLIILRDYGDTYTYHVYNRNTFKLIGKFGLIGRGPGEYLLPNMIYQTVKSDSGVYIYLYDNGTKKISGFNILDAVNKLNYYPGYIDLSKKKIAEAFPLNSAVITADSFVVGTSQNTLNLGRFFCYEIPTGNILWKPYFPIVSKKPHYSIQNHLYYNRMALRPDGKDIAVASLYFKRIDILNKKGALKRSIVFKNPYPEPDFTNGNRVPPKGANEFFSTMTVNQKSIYVLDRDKTTDINESAKQSVNDTITLLIASWDEDNRPVKSYKLTPRVFEIAIDEENQKLYGLKVNSSSLYIYELKENYK